MWATANRPKYNRDKLRYPSDLTGEEWAHIEALIPAAKHGGRNRNVDVREVVNGIMYVLSTGRQDLPPKSTLYDYFDLWTYDGTLETIHHALYVKCREQIGREASPTAAIIDSQSVKSAEKGALYRPTGLRRRQENQRQKAPYPRRYFRAPASCDRASGRYSRPRWRHARSLDPVRHVSVFAKALRRWRISRAGLSKGFGQSASAPRNRNRQTAGSRQRLRGSPTALGCRTRLRLVQPMPATGQGL